MAFDKVATRKNARLRLALSGVAGAGKTYSALLLAKEFGGQKIGLMDSERGSAQKYAGRAGLPTFYPEDLDEKNPQEYLAKIREAADSNVDLLIIDSYSHSWIGALETVDKMGGNKFNNGWKTVSPQVTKLVDAILSYPGHVIATMRSKAAYEVEKDERGKAVPKKLGMSTVSREGTDYEFDVMLDLETNGALTVSKTRCPDLTGVVYTREDIPKIAKTLKAWLSEGVEQTMVEKLRERIKFTQDAAALSTLAGKIKQAISDGKLTKEDFDSGIKAAYLQRKQELTT